MMDKQDQGDEQPTSEPPSDDGMNEDERHTAYSVTVLFEVFSVLLENGAEPAEAFEAAVWDIFTDEIGFHLAERGDPEHARKSMDDKSIRYRCTGYECPAKFSDKEAAKMHEVDNDGHWITES